LASRENIVVGITMGDPAGISPEIVAKLLCGPHDAMDGVTPIVIGDAPVMRRWVHAIDPTKNVVAHSSVEAGRLETSSVNVLQIGRDAAKAPIGEISAAAGAAAMAYNEAGAALASDGSIDGLLTAPLTKASAKLAGYDFAGQAEFFADRANIADFTTVLMYGGFWAGLLTTHLALADACRAITKQLILTKLRFIRDHQRFLGLQNIRIGVASLNPHGGESGTMGREEIDEIRPAIEAARAEGIAAEGPFPVNAIISPPYDGRGYDLTLAMYHDQAVARMNMHETTTLTLGLPFVRTSVGHGSALDIAGKGIADPRALAITYQHTVELIRRRLLMSGSHG
jgi:4-hydroxythreonine-4-phosphate dehydrogenase